VPCRRTRTPTGRERPNLRAGGRHRRAPARVHNQPAGHLRPRPHAVVQPRAARTSRTTWWRRSSWAASLPFTHPRWAPRSLPPCDPEARSPAAGPLRPPAVPRRSAPLPSTAAGEVHVPSCVGVRDPPKGVGRKRDLPPFV